MRTFALAVSAVLSIAPVTAAPFQLVGDQRWIVLASRPTPDEAIGVARYHQWKFPTVRVAKANNGLFAVIAGPVRVSNVQSAKDDLVKSSGAPKDMFFATGKPFQTLVWAKETTVERVVAKYNGGQSIVYKKDGLNVRLNKIQEGANKYIPTATADINGRAIFRITIEESSRTKDEVEKPDFSELFSARLDPTAPGTQFVFTSFWGGAHCCTVTFLATPTPSGKWEVIKAETLDASGYDFTDLDGDGSEELVSGDNSFLYRFGPYVSSSPPTKINQLRQGSLINVSRTPQFANYQRQTLSTMEYSATLNPQRWADNNFLAGWVAQSALVGRGEQAFVKAIEFADRSTEATDWLPEQCLAPVKIDVCPAGQKYRLTYAEALAKHLSSQGYGNFDAFVPRRTPPPAVTAVARPPDTLPAPSAAAPPVTPPAPKPDVTPKSFSGTAFFVTKAGHALTNAHVVTGCSNITLSTAAGVVTARLVAKDDANDIAVIQAANAPAAVATFRSGARFGEYVAAFGYPLAGMLSSSGNFTTGNITALSGLKDDTRYIQISAPVQPGNSGGPLVDGTGNVVGVVTAKLNALRVMLAGDGDIPQNVNFAIKSSTAQTFLESNGIEFDVGSRGAAVESDVLAERAKAISARVICRS